MDKNETQLVEGPVSLDKKEQKSEFVKTFERDDLGKTTTPSPILVGGPQEINLVKLPPDAVERFLWMHPVIPRGIEIKANRMIRRGITISPKNDNAQAKRAADEMRILFDNSGGLIGLKKWIEDAFGFGTGFRTLVLNKTGNKVLTLLPEHPVYFRIATFPEDFKVKELREKFKIDPKTKEPVAYRQWRFDKMFDKWIPVGPEIPANRVAPLLFDSWGDEKQGISLVQYLQLQLKYIMNIEEAGAETMFRNGFVQKKVTTQIMNKRELAELAKSLHEINHRDAIILPRGTDVENLNPGNTEFPEYHAIFLKLLAIRLGIPQPLLTMDGTTTNKATLDSQKADMYDDFSADELVIKTTIEDRIFEPACRLIFGKDFMDIPEFFFNETPEDRDQRAERIAKESLAIMNITNSASTLLEIGREEEAQKVLDYLLEFLDLDSQISSLRKNNPKNG